MKKLKYVLAVLTFVSLSIFTNVFGVDLTYLGKYVDPKNEKLTEDKIYLYFCVKKYPHARLTKSSNNDWEDTYSYLDNHLKEDAPFTDVKESENLDGTLGSYNTVQVNFTGLVGYEKNDRSYTTTYYGSEVSSKEDNDKLNNEKEKRSIF